MADHSIPPRRAAAGFTLIEVLVAMVVLGIGLLSVQALGVSAARSVMLAEKNSEFATVASTRLEAVLDTLGRDPVATLVGCAVTDAEAPIPAASVTRRVYYQNSRAISVEITVSSTATSAAARPADYVLRQDVFLMNTDAYTSCL